MQEKYTGPLEITITHKIDEKVEGEVEELFKRRWIALDWDRKGPNPKKYTDKKAKIDIELFHEMKKKGAAVVAIYRKTHSSKPYHRVVGVVKSDAKFCYYNKLLCLPLSNPQIFDASGNFLGNLVPRQCTIQRCHERAKGRLYKLANRERIPRNVSSLHHHDVEWLVTNYLLKKKICHSVWSGGRAHEGINHAGWKTNGKKILAQTTIATSQKTVKEKIDLLAKHTQECELHFFGFKKFKPQYLDGIEYHFIEKVFQELDKDKSGKKLIDSMLGKIKPISS